MEIPLYRQGESNPHAQRTLEPESSLSTNSSTSVKCAQDRSRTGTSVTSLVFETNASTNSATWAIPLLKPYPEWLRHCKSRRLCH